MTERVTISFTISDGRRDDFDRWLQTVTDSGNASHIEGYRDDNQLQWRPALRQFCDEMESVLRRHDHKRTWREKPIDALFRLLQLELEEAAVALDYFTVAEARHEMIDVANFAMILYDRLGLLDQDRLVRDRSKYRELP
jgi:hypothetical protein